MQGHKVGVERVKGEAKQKEGWMDGRGEAERQKRVKGERETRTWRGSIKKG